MDKISVGIIQRMIKDDKLAQNAVLQVLNIKEMVGIENQPRRFRLTLSDGVNFIPGMAAQSMNAKFALDATNRIQVKSLIRLKASYINFLNKERTIIIVLDAEVLNNGHIEEVIGDPQKLDNSTVQASADTQASSNTRIFSSKPEERILEPKRSTESNSNHAIAMIEALSPYQNKWTIKARVTAKTDIKNWQNQKGEGKLFSVNLMDESGEIRATAFNNEVDMLYDLLQEGSVYYISNCRVNIAKKEFTNIQHEYELHFERLSKVEKAEDEKSVPSIRYDFKKLANLGDVEKEAVVDVLGIVYEVSDLTEITSKATNKAVSKRDIIIIDDSLYQVKLTIWGKVAQTFSASPSVVIAFKGLKVSDFNGRSLSMYSTSTFTLNPDVPEAYHLKGWYENYGQKETFRTFQALNGMNNNSTVRLTTLQKVTDDNLGFGQEPDYYTCKATVMYIKKDNMSYPACPECAKKISIDGDNMWRCERCNVSFPNPTYRYILTLKVHDYTGQQWLNAFDEAGLVIIGYSANDLNDISYENEDKLNNVLQQCLGKAFIFRVRAKQDQYNGNVRIRQNILNASAVDFIKEGRNLISKIETYS